MLKKVIPDSVHEYVREHPKVLVWTCAALVAFNLYNLHGSMRMLIKAQEIARKITSDAAFAASEALGG